jgi:hypothetical protein
MTDQYKEPDRKAPRYRINRMLLLNKELHTRFIEKFPEYKELSAEDFKNIVKVMNTKIYENAVENRDGTELPEGLGYIFVGTCPPRKKPVSDPVASMKYGRKISHRNFESDNYLAKIFYTNFASKYRFKDREVWKFVAYRKFKNLVTTTYPENWKKYLQVDNMQRVSKVFMDRVNRNIGTKVNKIVTDEYNEFAL